MASLEPAELEDLFWEPINLEEVYAEAITQWEACSQENLIDKTLQFYTTLYLQDDILTKMDRASMMHSLEVRAPFLDPDLVNFVRRIPAEFKYRKGETKFLLKEALTNVLPREILYRRKRGFGVPIGKWFQCGDITCLAMPQETRVNPNFIERALRSHMSNKVDQRSFLWNVYLISFLGQCQTLWNSSVKSENCSGPWLPNSGAGD